MYSIHLSWHGMGVVEARGGEDAIEIAKTALPDVITTDLGLGDFAATNMCQRLKDWQATKGIPVIAVTGRAMPHEVTAALAAGCVSVLLKPCLPETLLNEIRRVLNASQKPSGTEPTL
jgi:CheY-like chemotaxis protein